jgi:hypothetical protein
VADALTGLLAAVAARTASVPGMASGHYPAPNTVEYADLPAAVVFSGSPNAESVIVRNTGGGQLWEPAVLVQVLGPRAGDTPQEFATIDALILPIVDAFEERLSVTVNGRTQHIDRCHVSGYRGSMIVNYAGVNHYAAEVYLSIKFRRTRGA